MLTIVQSDIRSITRTNAGNIPHHIVHLEVATRVKIDVSNICQGRRECVKASHHHERTNG